MKKTICLVLAALLMCGLAACGNGEDTASSQPPVSQPASQPSTPSEPAESLPEEIIELNQAFLTGLAKDADYPEGKRITAVMVNNRPPARPAYGISEAKMLVEIVAEGGITRFMALFENYETLPTVGSIRSARDQFLQLLLPYRGFYVHAGPGGEAPVNWMMRDYEYSPLNLDADIYGYQLIWQERARSSWEYNWYNTNGEMMTEAIANLGMDDYRSYAAPMFPFVSYNDPPRTARDGSIAQVSVKHSASYVSYFDYDAAAGNYKMSQYNSDNGRVDNTVDGNNNEQLAFENVLVMFAPMELYPGVTNGLVKADYSQGGAGYVFTQGGWELVHWLKGAPNERLWLEYFEYTDESDRYVYLNPGKTYLAMVDDDFLPAFDAALRANNMGETTGEVNQGLTEGED